MLTINCIRSLVICAFLLLFGYSTYRPSNLDNICDIFLGDTDWYEASRDAQRQWGTPIHVMMAIMHQESRFIDDAQPPRDWFLGIIPLPRDSSVYRYAQAQDYTWQEFRSQTDDTGVDRDDFEDAINFIGWYTNGSQKRLKLSKWDAYGQYLAYHEGRGGYQ
ncbi:MAG: hypothetical protein NPIRA02_17270 [Nitrospirales bacterium]|nr:MAG: hypothetical protein NPIRA02_17270 [Nitrospirales bacterium]